MTNLIPYVPQDNALIAVIETIKAAHPQSAAIPANVLNAAALLSLQVGANPNPLAGELYIYQIMGQWTPYLGVAYYRRVAEERGARVMFAPKDPETRLTWEPRAMTAEERAYHSVPDNVDAAICRGYRGDRLMELIDRGVPWRDAVEMLSRIGIGYLRDAEKKKANGEYMNPPVGRSWQWKCNQRAEKALYKMLGITATVQPLEAAHQPTGNNVTVIDMDDTPYTLEDANADLF